MSVTSGKIVWLFGPSGAGKTTLANALSLDLQDVGLQTFVLDGDMLRRGLCCDLGFTDLDRSENIRRAAEISLLMASTGCWVIATFITPLLADRATVRRIVGPKLIEVFINCPIEICEKRDPKGLYRQFRSGKILNMSGLDSPFEFPMTEGLEILTHKHSIDEGRKLLLQQVLDKARF